MKSNELILILNELDNRKDINEDNISTVIEVLEAEGIDNIFFYFGEYSWDNYFSELEIVLGDINKCGYPVGYTADILLSILKNVYTEKELTTIRVFNLITLFKLNADKLAEKLHIKNYILFEVTKKNVIDIVVNQTTMDKLNQLEKFFNLYANWNKYSKTIVITSNGNMVKSNLLNEFNEVYTIEEFKQIVIEILEGAIITVEDIPIFLEFITEVYLNE